MPSIIIREQDLTNPVVNELPTDVVYIPGFTAKLDAIVGEPTYVDNLEDFHTLFGDVPFNFGTDARIGAWDSTKTYGKYAIVAHDGRYYVSKEADNSDNEPVDPESEDYADDHWTTNTLDPWDDDATYAEFTMVTYGGLIYVKTNVEKTGKKPGEDGATDWTTNEVISGAGTDAVHGVTTEIDTAFVYAETLLRNGLPIYYEVIANGDVRCEDVATFYTKLKTAIEKLDDKGVYSIKYISTGGYPTFGYKTGTGDSAKLDLTLVKALIGTAAKRGDAIALIDHIDKLPLSGDDSAFGLLNKPDVVDLSVTTDADGSIDGGTYSTMFTYWDNYERLPITYSDASGEAYTSIRLPGSFACLACLSLSLQNNPSWLAVAGVTRGLVPYVNHTSTKVTNKLADSYQTYGKGYNVHGRSINGITNIRPYGLTIWGNRTLANNTANRDLGALSYLNLRLLVCDVKKAAYAAAQRFMFEQNNDLLWLNFKSAITPLLDRMSTSGGISGYKIVKQKCKDSAKLVATIILNPVYAVESFEIGIQLTNEEVTIVE